MTKCGKSVFNQLQPQQVLQRSGTIMDLQTHSPFRHNHVLKVLAMITSEESDTWCLLLVSTSAAHASRGLLIMLQSGM